MLLVCRLVWFVWALVCCLTRFDMLCRGVVWFCCDCCVVLMFGAGYCLRGLLKTGLDC